MSANTPSRHISAQERIRLNMNKANTPMVCECGSTHFFKIYVEEYAEGGYGSVSLRPVSQNQESFYACICCKPVQQKDTSTGKTSEGSRARFLRSLSSAIEYLGKNTPQGIAAGMVSIAEYQELHGQVTAQH